MTEKTEDSAELDSAQAEPPIAPEPAPQGPAPQDITPVMVAPSARTDAAATDDDVDHDHDHDEHHVSLAARSLQILGLLMLGGVIALWGGPKLAPLLPAGMAPVAQWLAPGSSMTDAQIAGLRAAFDARLQAQPTPISLSDVDARIADAALSVELRAMLDQLRADMDAVNAAPAELSARLDGVDTRVLGLAGMVDTLGAELRALVVPGGEIDNRTAMEITAYAATLDGLRAEISDLNARLIEQAARIDAVTGDQRAATQSAIATAAAQQARARVDAAILSLQTALDSGLPYATPLAVFADQGLTIPAGLAVMADRGVVQVAVLLEQFPSLAHAAIRAETTAQGGRSTMGQLGAFLQAQVATRSLTPQDGTSADAILSRAEAALKSGDLDSALREMRTLSAPAAAVFVEWRRTATARRAAEQGLAQLGDAAKRAGAGQ